MRLTIRLEPELYAVAKSLAKAEDCSLSTAVNRLLHRALAAEPSHPPPTRQTPTTRHGLPISRARRPITAEDVARTEEEENHP
ncbi:MAG: hypothetical protein KF833_07200 [Verrucomicrobiae bacterium]|nr:hypothetical protein [Verrucomicrobiae bacterium]